MRNLVVLLGALGLAMGCGDDGGSSPDMAAMCSGTSCDDGVFCNGVEACSPSSPMANPAGCVPGANPCGTDRCNEGTDSCERDCTVPDADGDGVDAMACGGIDCDDGDVSVHPGATEVCDADDVDEDCNPETFGFTDLDGDGQGSAVCCNGDRCGPDCDDANGNVGRDRTEACDGVDNDCDANVDEGVQTMWFPDTDGDGFGDPEGTPILACTEPPGYSERATDCDDTAAAVNPGVPEVCDAFDDNDCNPDTDNPFDLDDDGFDGLTSSCPTGPDCDDSDPAVHPGAAEICDGKDSNCDGAEFVAGCAGICTGTCNGECSGVCSAMATDGTCAGFCDEICTGECAGTCDGIDLLWMGGEDADFDGFLDPTETCTGGPRGGLSRTDCDDLDGRTHPGAPELCDRLDNDCDLQIDEEFFEGLTEPTAPMALAGGGAPDLSCVGVRTRPTPGATVSTTLSAATFGQVIDLDGVGVQIWATNDATDLVCSSPDCQNHVFDASGEVTVSHPVDATLATVVEGRAGDVVPTLSIVQPGQEFGAIFAVPTSGLAAPPTLVVGVTDCSGVFIESLQLRIVRASGLPVCDVSGLNLAGANPVYTASGLVPPPAAIGELVTVEAWGRPSPGAPFELVARERIRIRSDVVSVLPMGPLRADGPPAP